MILSANLFGFYDIFGIEKLFDIYADAGFNGVDFNNDLPEYRTAQHDERFYRDLAEYASQKGIKIYQAHAPFPSSFTDEKESVMEALADIGYMGDVNYEASNFVNQLPKELRLDAAKYMVSVGHYLIKRFEYHKNKK